MCVFFLRRNLTLAFYLLFISIRCRTIRKNAVSRRNFSWSEKIVITRNTKHNSWDTPCVLCWREGQKEGIVRVYTTRGLSLGIVSTYICTRIFWHLTFYDFLSCNFRALCCFCYSSKVLKNFQSYHSSTISLMDFFTYRFRWRFWLEHAQNICFRPRDV